MNKEDLLIKWLDGELSAAELDTFQQQKEYASYEKLYKNAIYFKSPKIDKEQQYTNFQLKLAKKNTAPKFMQSYRFLLRIAAVLVIGFSLYFTLNNSDLVKVNTLVAQHTNITLPDNSEVTVNAASLVKYNKEDWDKKRQLTLEGEAFFKVAKGAKFEVKTKIGIVSVLGTRFNVKQRDEILEVTCFEGLVNVTIGDKSVKLHAGETIRFSKNMWKKGKTFLNNPSWIDGKSSFTSVPYHEVLAEFERQLGLKVTIENVDATKLFTGSFVHDNNQLALKSITQPFKLSYDITNRDVKIFKHE